MAWPWHGRQRRRDSGFTWWHVACCLMSVACVCVCVRVCYAVGLGRRSGVGWLPSGCTRRPQAGAVARCMSAWRSHGCRAAGRPCAGRRRAGAAPSRRGDAERPRVSCSTEPCTMQQTPCKRTPCKRTPCKPTACGVMGALDRAMCKVHRCGRQRATCEQSACVEADDEAGQRCPRLLQLDGADACRSRRPYARAPLARTSKRHISAGTMPHTHASADTRACARKLHSLARTHTHPRTHAHARTHAHTRAARVGYAASAARHRCRVPSAGDRLECIAHVVCCPAHVVGCSLSFVCCMLPSVAQLHGVSCILHVLCCMPHIVCRLSSVVCCITAWCQLHGACFALPVGRRSTCLRAPAPSSTRSI